MIKKSRIISASLLVLGLLSATSATATVVYTTPEAQTFSKTSLNFNQNLTFAGYDGSVVNGTLNSVHFKLTYTETLNNRVSNSTDQPVDVGTPVPLSATATTTVTGPLSLTATNTLTTDNYVGSVVAGTSIVGTKTITDATLIGVIDPLTAEQLALFEGGANTVSFNVVSAGNQGGSVPDTVFTGNSGSFSGTLEVWYDVTVPDAPAVPEPAMFGLIGLGMTAFAASRRRKYS